MVDKEAETEKRKKGQQRRQARKGSACVPALGPPCPWVPEASIRGEVRLERSGRLTDRQAWT